MKNIGYLLLIVCAVNSSANDMVALLKSIEANHILHMKYKQNAFVCQPYGVETVSELVYRTDINSSCMEHLQAFRLADPNEKYFSLQVLRIEQQYSVEGAEGKCLLYLSSGHTYSEALLENGYARTPPLLQHKDFILRHRFKQAEQRAKIRKAGIWSDVNVRNCFLAAKKKR